MNRMNGCIYLFPSILSIRWDDFLNKGEVTKGKSPSIHRQNTIGAGGVGTVTGELFSFFALHNQAIVVETILPMAHVTGGQSA